MRSFALGRVALAAIVVVAPLVAGAAPAAAPVAGSAPSATASGATVAARGVPALGRADSLRLEQAFDTADQGRIVRYRQLHRGLPVLGAMVVVRMAADGRVLEVASSVRPVAVDDVQPVLGADEAIAIARGAVSDAPLPTAPRAGTALAISQGHGGRLVWVVDVDTLVPVVAPTAVVDARTGELLSIRNRAVHARASVFSTGKAAKDARRADGTFDGTGRALADLPGLSAAGGVLASPDIVAANCCPNEGCDRSKPAKRTSGVVDTPIGQVTIDSVMCDERPLAAADADGNFIYDPATEPTKESDPVPGPSEGDAFSEVMAFHYAQSTLEWARSLDPQFQLGPDARPLHVVANLLFPKFDQQQIAAAFQTRQVKIDQFMRFDNAAFVPKGQADQLAQVLPALAHPYDTLVFGQGTTADFAYDADVVSHEFGHGIVSSVTGGLSEGQYVADDWGVVDAPGAINEAVADAIAAFRANDPHIGEYVGAFGLAGEGALRELTSDARCPSVILGEVHQDSQHVSAALWAAREAVAGASEADRHKFDQALLATIRSFLPTTSFDDMGGILAREVERLFDAAAKAKVQAALNDRRVTGCERFVELVPGAKRSGYQLAPASRQDGLSPYTPGPVQFRLTLPVGATGVKLSMDAPQGGLGGFGGFGGGASVQAIARAAERVHFTYGRTSVTSDATKTVPFQDRGSLVAQWSVEASCTESTWFVALGNGGQQPVGVEGLEVSYAVDQAKVTECTTRPGDGGAPAEEAGSGGDAASPGGCSCGAGEASVAFLAGLGAVVRRRRQGRR